MRKIIFLLFLLPLFVHAQNVVAEYPLPSGVKWVVNGRGDVIYTKNDGIVLLASDGRVLKQSVKSIGLIDQFQIVNTLKFLVFSSEQQLICFFDNSLSNLDQCLDLEEMGYAQVTKVAASSQSDKIWIYDEVNSVLSLHSMLTNIQNQMVVNLRGTLGISEVTEIVEYNNNLIIIDKHKGLYFFDRFGTFENFFPIERVQHLEVIGRHLLLLVDEDILECSIQLDGTYTLTPLGYEMVNEFHYNGESLFIQKGNKIEKIRY